MPGKVCSIVPFTSSHAAPVVGDTGEGSLGCSASIVIASSRMARLTCSTASPTLESIATRMLTIASAFSGIAFAACAPESCVTTWVVRTIAFVSSPSRAKRVRSGIRVSHRFVKIHLRGCFA